MAILVVAEHDNQQLKAATLNTVTAASLVGQDVDLLIAGAQCAEVARQAAQIRGVRKVLHCDAAHYADQTAENLAALILSVSASYSHLFAPASSFGKNVMPRVAARLDVAQVSEITAVEAPNRFVRPIYAGNALATIESDDPVKVVTVRATAFAAAEMGGSASVEPLSASPDVSKVRVVGRELTQSARPELGNAKIVVSGGRGLGNGEQYRALLEPLADRLNAALGASRAAVDAGYVPNDFQVGQTGKVVAPQLYLAVGISGAIQHLAGMKDSKIVVAINKDPDAPIFQVADYGLVADLFEAVPQLTAALAQ
ncbi:FAD-binding protein [Crenobacter sp. SG2303]|uniref:FAD-binding protein n=1 Tax=Crenobacter oryzisoli TaxID=3056844 RepID=A0ABT7XNB4_9NEIS|nr:FAD-binding protein [Crenobacter sp. SG2303]MDN0075291.1 FAD-binding protein [Crenobacter sp. SG2303]